MTRSMMLAIGLAVVTPACECPSLYLSLTKAKVAPREPVSAPVPDPLPLPLPPEIANRFIVQGAALARDSAPQFNDTSSDPATLDASLLAFESIQRYADPAAVDVLPQEGLSDAVEGVVKCLENQCDEIHVSYDRLPPTASQFAEITVPGQFPVLAVIGSCEIEDDSAGASSCDDHLGDATYSVTLHRSLPVTAGQRVKVRFSAAAPIQARTLLTFVHLSDIQIRDTDVKLGDPELSKRLDFLIQSFEYDPDLQFYNRYLVESLFASINAEYTYELAHRFEDAPLFAIHTGDAIDAGVNTELREVHRLFDSLQIPLFDALGNHDVLVFGNMMPTHDPHDDSDCATATSIAGAEFGFARKHPHWLPNKLCVNRSIRCVDCPPGEVTLIAQAPTPPTPTHPDPVADAHELTRQTFMAELTHHVNQVVPQLPRWSFAVDKDHKSACDWRNRRTTTSQHGFDLNGTHSYYAFAQPIQIPGEDTPRFAVFLALDTNDYQEGKAGALGAIQKAQIDWLEQQLVCTDPRDLVFVFGHHPIGGIDTTDRGQDPGALEAVLDRHDNVVAYLYGHHHEHAICRDRRPQGACNKFWEIETGSLIEFPQEARRVKIKYAGRGLAFLELTTFRERILNTSDARRKAVDLARRGAERDHCRTHARVVCSEDLRVYRDDGADANARLWFRIPGARRL